MAETQGMSGRFGRILLAVNALASVGFLVTAVQGYGFTAFEDQEALQRHLLWALATTLVILFAHSWMFIYLLSLRRELRQWAAQQQGGAASFGGRRPAFWAAGALTLVLAVFLLGPAVLVASLPPWVHGAAAYGALVVQVLALLFEFQALRRSDRALALWAAEAASASAAGTPETRLDAGPP